MMLLQKFKATKKLKGKVAARKEIEKLFTFLQRTNLYISRHVAESVLSFCGKENAKFSFIYSTNNDFAGKCKNCGGQLPKYNPSDKDRLQLVEILTKFGLTETDIHQNTNPEEFKRFLKFLDNNNDFDLGKTSKKKTADLVKTALLGGRGSEKLLNFHHLQMMKNKEGGVSE